MASRGNKVRPGSTAFVRSFNLNHRLGPHVAGLSQLSSQCNEAIERTDATRVSFSQLLYSLAVLSCSHH